MRYVLGSELPAALQREALARYVHRFTRDHKPRWATERPWKLDTREPYPVQFDSDADWLAHTIFPVTAKGRIAERPGSCASTPTWPDNPELRPGGGSIICKGPGDLMPSERS
jgi:hypothetical protein